MEARVIQIKFESLERAVNLRPVPVAIKSVFSVFDDEFYHREIIVIYEEIKAA